MRGQIDILEKEALTFEELVARFGVMHSESGFSKEEFEKLSAEFPQLRMERESDGKILVMSPVKPGSGRREVSLLSQLYLWNYQVKKGEVLSPSTGFDLPDGTTKSPDAAWISSEKYALMDEEKGFATEVPDFVAEIRSGTDRLVNLKKKMKDTWMKNGVRLAWLVDPYSEQVFIYRQGQDVEKIKGFSSKSLSGEDVLPGFELSLEEFMLRKK